jgi:AcrR family transcriptional regulator
LEKTINEDMTTRTRILEATVKLLYTAQPKELTTRRISREAQVNIAAINYHFRSKDELIDEAVRAATAEAFEKGKAVLHAPGKEPLERLREYLVGYSTGLVKFPALTRTAWQGLFNKEGGETFFGRFMKEMLELVGQIIEEIQKPDRAGRGSHDSAATALMVLSCVIFPFLVSSTIRDAGAVDYADDESRKHYIDETLARLVAVTNKEIQNG